MHKRRLTVLGMFLVMLCLTLFVNTGISHAREDELVLHERTQHLVIGQGVEYLVETDPLTHLQAADAGLAEKWRAFGGREFSSGVAQAPSWFRFDMHNQAHSERTWLLEVGWPLLDRVELFVYNHGSGAWSSKQVAGNSAALEGAAIKHRNVLFPLELQRGEHATVYLRVTTLSSLFLSIDLWQSRAFFRHDQHRTLLVGLFFGILSVMMLYNFCLYLFVRERSYLAYTFYVLAVILYELASTGIGGRYVWDQFPYLQNSSYLLFAALSFLGGTIFIRLILRLKMYGGWVYHLNNGFLTYWGLATVICLLTPYSPVLRTMQLAALITPVAGLVTSVFLWFKGNIQAKYYTIANLALNLGTMILMLGLSGVLKRGPLTEYSQMVGFGLEAVLLSLALADRINRERASREAAQQEALVLSRKVSNQRAATLQAQEQVLAVQKQANEELELRVLDRTNELERAMKSLELANQALSKLSYTDPLTKVHNRRYFDQVLASELKRASRTRQQLSLMMVDIDHFKDINDTHGHLVGDDCLRRVAKTLNSQMQRESDLLARYGGEEFAAVLPATDPDQAVVVAERARQAVQEIDFIHGGERVLLRVSIGVAGWIPGQAEKADRLIGAADQALYQAKENGRNRSVAAAGEGLGGVACKC